MKNRITALENSMSQLSDYQTIKEKINNGKYVVSCTQAADGSYTIAFSDKTTVTLKNGKDGKDGQNGTNGTNGTNGKDGANGKDGVTPIFKIESESWYVSYDEGKSWSFVGSAIDRSLFKAVKVEGDYLKLTLADNTETVLAIGEKNQFRISIDEGGIVMSSDNGVGSRTRWMEIPFTLTGKVIDPKVIVSFEYGEYGLANNEQMFYAEVIMNGANDGGVIKFKQPFSYYYEDSERTYYLETAKGRMNIMAFNGDGLSCAKSKYINPETILCQFDMDYDWEYLGLVNNIPAFKMPKAGGVIRADVWRTVECREFDLTKMIRPAKFNDVFSTKISSSDGSVTTSFYDNGKMSDSAAYSESYTAYFDVKANTGSSQKQVPVTIGKYHSESGESAVLYFQAVVILDTI